MKLWRWRRRPKLGEFKARYDDAPRRKCNWPSCLNVVQRAEMSRILEESLIRGLPERFMPDQRKVCRCNEEQS